MTPIVELVPIHLGASGGLLAPLARGLARAFRVPVRTRPPWFDPESAYDASRGQYSSTLLLGQLLTGDGRPEERLLGVTSVDLFIPVLTYVFGEAQLEGRAAVVSIHRLRNELYGMPHDPGRLAERLLTESVHEIGHTFGLLHCHEPGCAMHASTYVEEIDLKPPRFCDACDAVVAARIG